MENNVFKPVTLVLCLLVSASIGFAEKTREAPTSKTTRLKEKPQELSAKEELKPKMGAIAPTRISSKSDQSTVEIIPVKPQQTDVQAASALDDKGKQLKWQVVSSGGEQGASSAALPLKEAGGYELDATIAQTAVGFGTSASYQLDQGFWQTYDECPGRGDANSDGGINIADASYIINYLFVGGPAPDPFCNGDANSDGGVNIADASYIINYLFVGGPPPGC